MQGKESESNILDDIALNFCYFSGVKIVFPSFNPAASI